MLGAQQRFGVLDPATCPQNFRFVNQLHRMPAIMSLREKLPERFRTVMSVDNESTNAGRDQVVSTAAIEDLAVRLRAGSHLIVAGARHELMMEQDRYRAQFWAAFDAFVPGTPLFK